MYHVQLLCTTGWFTLVFQNQIHKFGDRRLRPAAEIPNLDTTEKRDMMIMNVIVNEELLLRQQKMRRKRCELECASLSSKEM